MTEHQYIVTASVVFGGLTLIWASSSPLNFLIKLGFGVLTIAGIFLLAGVK